MTASAAAQPGPPAHDPTDRWIDAALQQGAPPADAPALPAHLPWGLLRALPKTDLHVHLDGSLREQTLIELARERGVPLPSETVEGLNDLVFKRSYASLEEYLHGFGLTCAVLQDAEALERAAYELGLDNIADGVVYAEVRFAPQLHMHGSFGFDEVLRAVDRGLRRAAVEHAASPAVAQGGLPAFRYGIVVCALRYFSGAFSRWYASLCGLFRDARDTEVFRLASLELARAAVRCRDEHAVPIVGLDLAGREDGYPAQAHREAFAHAHRHFLKKTVHAGEAYGPESIFSAITALYADRLGHGYHLFSPEACGPEISDPDEYVAQLAEFVADRRITVEVCITSNLQTNPRIARVEDHVFGRMLREKLSATLCTDNRLVSHTSVTREFALAVAAFGMDQKAVRETVTYGFKRSFYPGPYLEKRAWVRDVLRHFDRVLARFNAAQPAG